MHRKSAKLAGQAIQFAQKKRLEANFLKLRVFLSVGAETEEMTSTEVKINTVCKYNSPTFWLSKLDYTYHNRYS